MDCWLLGSAMFECLLSLFAQETPRLRLLLIPSVRDWERGYIVQTGTCSDWPPHRSVNYKTIVASSMAPLFFFLRKFKVRLQVPSKTCRNGHFLSLSNSVKLCETQLPFSLFIMVDGRVNATPGQRTKVQTLVLFVCLFFFVRVLQTCLYLLSALMKKL